MHSYCLRGFYLLGYIKAVFVTTCYNLTAVALNERCKKIMTFREVKHTTCVNEFAFLSLICVWAEGKQHLGWLLMGSCKRCETKCSFWGQSCRFCFDPRCGAEQRSADCR